MCWTSSPVATDYRRRLWKLLIPHCTSLTFFQFQQEEEEFHCMKIQHLITKLSSRRKYSSLSPVAQKGNIREARMYLAIWNPFILLAERSSTPEGHWLYCICPNWRNTPSFWFYCEFCRRNLVITSFPRLPSTSWLQPLATRLSSPHPSELSSQ